jgi:hypothetical protein
MVHMYYELDVDDDNYLYQILFDYTCMLRIGCCRLMSHLPHEVFACLEV